MYIEKATENFMTIEDIVINPKTFKQNPDKPYPSTGWWGGGKLTDDDGVTYQVQAQAVLHKSSELGTPEPTEALKLGTQTIARKRGKDGSDGFGTGSKGY